jgi:hypothetical protein
VTGSKVVNAVWRVRKQSVKSTPCRRESVSSSALSAASIEKSANMKSPSEPKVYSDSSVPLHSRVNAGTARGLGFEGHAKVTVVELFEASALGMMEDVDGTGLGCASVGLGAGFCDCRRGPGRGEVPSEIQGYIVATGLPHEDRNRSATSGNTRH